VQVNARSDYAVRACAELALLHGTGPVKGERLAELQGVPFKFLENILLSLKRSGIVASQRGADGGYWLAKDPARVTVADIVRAVDGPLAAVRGMLPDTLEYGGAATHLAAVWVALRAGMRAVLESVSLADLVAGDLAPHIRALVDDPSAWSSKWT